MEDVLYLSLKQFEWMCEEGIQPDDISFVFLLSALKPWWMQASPVMFQWSQLVCFLQNWDMTLAWVTFLAMLTINSRQRFWWGQCPWNYLWHHGWLCLALAEFMVIWRWENMLLNKFLNRSLKMLLVTWCYWTSMLFCWQHPSLRCTVSSVPSIFKYLFWGIKA